MTIYAEFSYLEKHKFQNPLIQTPPSKELGLAIVIPCYNEPNVVCTLQSLYECALPHRDIEVITVINAAASDSPEVKAQNIKTSHEINHWRQSIHSENLHFHFLLNNALPPKHAGVGLARKIGMDEAVARFEQAGKKDGVIVCLDADCHCEANYLIEIEHFFNQNPTYKAASLYFEHPLATFPGNKSAITSYELYLRYYVEALRLIGHPYAFHTIGSSMAVRADAYQQQGGMNRRKAGEDLYFLQKFMSLGALGEITNTTVYPSARTSERVPFGTGKAILDIQNLSDGYPVFQLNAFLQLSPLLQQLDQLYSGKKVLLPEILTQFLAQENFEAVLEELHKHTNSFPAFYKRFFRWFNRLKVLQYLNYTSNNGFPKQAIVQQAHQLLLQYNEQLNATHAPHSLLHLYRKRQKEVNYTPFFPK